MTGEPYPKQAQLARGPKRYRRKVASAKQWQTIIAAKTGPCRVCRDAASNGATHSHIHHHHVVPRSAPWFGDDVAENIVPLCPDCHDRITRREPDACYLLVWKGITDREYSYAIERGGEGFFERAYGIRYER